MLQDFPSLGTRFESRDCWTFLLTLFWHSTCTFFARLAPTTFTFTWNEKLSWSQRPALGWCVFSGNVHGSELQRSGEIGNRHLWGTWAVSRSEDRSYVKTKISSQHMHLQQYFFHVNQKWELKMTVWYSATMIKCCQVRRSSSSPWPSSPQWFVNWAVWVDDKLPPFYHRLIDQATSYWDC